MPNIREYEAENTVLRPSETGTEATARSGRIINEFFRESGQAIGGAISTVGKQVGEEIDRHQTAAEISKGFADGLTQKNTADTAWSEAAKDPAFLQDPKNQQKFLQDQATQWQDWSSKFSTKGGQAWAQQFAQNAMNHTASVTKADLVNHAGDMALVQLSQATNQAADMAAKSPANLDFALASVDVGVRAQLEANPALSVEARSKLMTTATQHMKETIVKSAILGLAQRDPDAADRLLDSGKYDAFISGGVERQAINTLRHARDQEARLARVEARQIATEKSQTQAAAVLDSLAVKGPDGRPTGEIKIDPKLPAQILVSGMKLADKEATYRFVQTVQNEQERNARTASDPATYEDLRQRVADGTTVTPIDIMKAANSHLISPHDAIQLQKTLTLTYKNPQQQAEYKALDKTAAEFQPLIQKAGINGGPSDDAAGKWQYANLLRDVHKAYDEQRAAGVPTADLLDPTKSTYLFRSIQKYIMDDRAKVQWTRNILAGGGPAGEPPPVAPGAPVPAPAKTGGVFKSMADWLKENAGKQP